MLNKKDGLVIMAAWAGFISLMFFPARNSFVSMAHAESNNQNIALHKAYTCDPIPNYQNCKDVDDDIQLTDGIYATGILWVQKETVGWTGEGKAAITIDLDKVEPIKGVLFHTGAGQSDAKWLKTIRMLASLDGKAFYDIGDLVALNENPAPKPEGYQAYAYQTNKLRTKGRYLRLEVIPEEGPGEYIFCDEIEIYRGDDTFLDLPYSGEVTQPAELQNPVRNYSFETVNPEDKTKAQDWEGNYRLSDISRKGVYSACLGKTEGKNELISREIDIAPNSGYLFSCWSKGSQGRVYLIQKDKTGKEITVKQSEVIASKEWRNNHLELKTNPAAAKLIIKFTGGSPQNEVYFDDITLRELSYVELNQTYNVLSDAVVTPHVNWANPYYLGKLKVLVIAPTWAQRETIELHQRLPMDYRPLMTYDCGTLTGGTYLGVTPQEVLNDAENKLSQDLDLIIIGGMVWSAFPENIQAMILDKVRNGTGLVWTVDRLSTWKGELTPTDEGREIFSGIPTSFLPLLKDQNISGSIKTYTYQKGRVVGLNYGSPGAQQTLTPVSLYLEKNCYYEYFMSIVAKAALWAGQKEPQITFDFAAPLITRDRLSQDSISINLSNGLKNQPYLIEVSVRDTKGQEEYNSLNKTTLPLGESAYSFSLPVTLKTGEHFVDLWIKDNGQVINWGTVPLKVTSPNVSISKFELNKENYREGDTLTGDVLLSQELKTERLEVELWDNYGRLVAQEPVKAEGTKAGFLFQLPEPCSVMHYVKLSLQDSRGTIDEKEIEFPILRKEKSRDYYFMGWGYAFNEYPNTLMLKALANYGLDVLYECGSWMAGTPANKMRVILTSRANLGYAPYGWETNPGRAPFGEVLMKDGYPVFKEPITDESYLLKYRDTLKTNTRDYSPYAQPFIYTLGDEPALELGQSDVDFSPSALLSFQAWAKEKYRTIAEANKAWQTSFKDFSEVRPVTLQEARISGNYSRWVDHRLHMEYVFSNTLKIGRDTVKSVNPEAYIGIEGLVGPEYPPSFLGYNWYQIMQVCDFMGVYGGVSGQLARSFAQPGTAFSAWTGSYDGQTKAGIQTSPWRSLFLGGDSISWYSTSSMHGNGGEAAISLDLAPLPWLRDIVTEITKIKSGAGKLLLSSQVSFDPIAVHYSNLCIHASTIDSQVSSWKDSVYNFDAILQDLGFQYRFLATEEIAQGKLNEGKFKVLILPFSQILTKKEVSEIEKFVSDGGTLITDFSPGVRDEGGNLLKESALSFLFSSMTTANTKDYGKGKAFLLGPMFKEYLSKEKGPLTPEASLTAQKETKGGEWERSTFANLLGKSGLQARLKIQDKEGKVVPGCSISSFEHGRISLFGIIPPANQVPAAVISFPGTGYVYELREGKYCGLAPKIETDLMPGEPKLYAVSPEKINSLTVKGDKAVFSQGDTVNLTCTLNPADIDDVVNIEVFDPNHQKMGYLTGNYLIKGKNNISIPLALNQAKGVYRVKAREAIAGNEAGFSFEIK